MKNIIKSILILVFVQNLQIIVLYLNIIFISAQTKANENKTFTPSLFLKLFNMVYSKYKKIEKSRNFNGFSNIISYFPNIYFSIVESIKINYNKMIGLKEDGSHSKFLASLSYFLFFY